MKFHSDDHKAMSGVFDRNATIWACSQVEATLAVERSPSSVGWREKSMSEGRVISALISLSDFTVREAAEVLGLTEDQGVTRRRKFLDDMTGDEQRAYLDAVRVILQRAVSDDK